MISSSCRFAINPILRIEKTRNSKKRTSVQRLTQTKKHKKRFRMKGVQQSWFKPCHTPLPTKTNIQGRYFILPIKGGGGESLEIIIVNRACGFFFTKCTEKNYFIKKLQRSPQECMDNKKWQDDVLSTAGKYSIAFITRAILVGGVYYSSGQENGGLNWAGNHILNTGARIVGGIRGYLPV